MNRLWSSQEGITLIGVLAFVSILSLVWTFALSSISTGGTALVQRPAPRVIVVDDGGLAFKYLNEAADLFVKDARSAVRTDLVDGAPPASSVTLSWTEEFLEVAIPRTASYRLDGDVLVRTFDGHSRIVARKLVSAAFSLSGNEIAATLVVESTPDTTKAFTVNTLLGLPPG